MLPSNEESCPLFQTLDDACRLWDWWDEARRLCDGCGDVTDTPEEPDLLTPEEVSRRLYVSKRELGRLVDAGKIAPPIRVSERLRRFRRTDVEDYERGPAAEETPTYAALLHERLEASLRESFARARRDPLGLGDRDRPT
jgi:excisionase family DNA binding protein